jgi:dTDP-4-dehydrorhamnose reductase
MKLLVIGAAGQLGSTFADVPGHEVVGLTRADVDVTDHGALLAAVAREQPDVLINCTAYNNVDGAEDDVATALAVNALAVRSLAAAAARVGASFVHYSTDFVFDGEASTPYREDDRTRPVSVYGCSKLLGEWFARDAPRWYVLRVESLFGGPQARSSVDKIAAALRAGRPTPVFVDRIVTPSYVEDVKAATLALLARDVPSGVFHCVNSQSATWADVGVRVADVLGADPALLVRTSVKDVQLRAHRPVYCALANDRLASATGAPMPSWQDAIARYLKAAMTSSST